MSRPHCWHDLTQPARTTDPVSKQDNNKDMSPLKRAFIALEEANRKIKALEQNSREPIAIVGMGCRFPGGAVNPAAYWQMLHAGRDAITTVPGPRWGAEPRYPEGHPANDIRGGFLQDVDTFDAEFFGISPREANCVDPQQRLLLEVAWEALEDAGISPHSLSGSATGVYIGLCKSDYGAMQRELGDDGGYGMYPLAGGAFSMASGRLSYFLGLQGPSLTIDTACSSSLVALGSAFQSLQLKDCDTALVGGVSLMLSPENTLSYAKAEMMSPDGLCRTFDEHANGFVQGEGCGVVVLKRLTDAEAAGDNIIGVIHATAVNQDGPSSGLTAPNGEAQEAVIRKALQQSGLTAADIDYIEAHGTGTSLGDPIEMRAISAVLSGGHDKQNPLLVGSVKTNIGHLESAAGMASLIKVLLSLRYDCIPPHINFSAPSSFIDWDNIPVQIPTRTQDWARNEAPRYAGISGFGFSGTNVHAIVSDYCGKPKQIAHPASGVSGILTLSARSAIALQEKSDHLAAFLDDHPEVPVNELVGSCSTGRSHFAARMAITGDSVADFRAGLDAIRRGETVSAASSNVRRSSVAPRVALLFTGQGSQFASMGKDFYANVSVFREAFDECDAGFARYLDDSLAALLYRSERQDLDKLLENTAWQQPALFAFEYAMARFWQQIGVVPTAVAGHSLGEYVAACVAGLFTLDDACRLVAARGRLMQSLPADGAMLAVNAAHDKVLDFLEETDKKIAVAAVNGPLNTVLSGATASIERIADVLQQRDVTCTRLNVSHAFHSPLMQPMLADFERELEKTEFGSLRMSLVSNLSGKSGTTRQMANKDYWLQHIVNPVRFEDSIGTLRQRGCEVFIEVGPHPVLISMGQACTDQQDLTWIGSSRRPTARHRVAPTKTLALAVARYYTAGGQIDWAQLYGNRRPVSHELPTYPFQRSRYWFEDAPEVHRRNSNREHPLLGYRISTPLHTALFENELAIGDFDFVDDHIVHGTVVLPATAIIEMCLAAAASCGLTSPKVNRLQLLDAIRIPAEGHITIQTVIDDAGGENCLRVYARAGSDSWKLHCEAEIESARDAAIDTLADSAPDSRDTIAQEDFYAALYARGLHFGDSLQRVTNLQRRDGFASSVVELDGRSAESNKDFIAHPAVLDACLQTMAAAVPGFSVSDRDADVFMPVSFEAIETGSALHGVLHVSATVDADEQSGEILRGNVEIVDANNVVVLALRSIALKKATSSDLSAGSGTPFYKIEWQEKSLPQEASHAGRILQGPESIGKAQSFFQKLASDNELRRYFEGLSELEGIAIEYVVAALHHLGWEKQAGVGFSAEALCAELNIDGAHSKLLKRFLQMLIERDFLAFENDRYVVARDLTPAGEPVDIESFITSWPEVRAESELLSRCGPRIADMLRGRADPLELLFPEGDTEAGAAIYTKSPLARTFNATVAEVVATVTAGLPDGRRLRVLEIGGGTGGTTRFISDRVDSTKLEYTFTDIGPLFVDRAEQRFGSDPAFRFATFDVERDPVAQGLERGAYDLVIAANVIHATRNLDRTLTNIRSLLAVDGLLLMTEVVKRLNWIDTTFGFTSGWWHFEDYDRRPDYPLLSVNEWQRVLGENGFTDFERITPAGSGGEANAVLLSRNSAIPVVPAIADASRPDLLVISDVGGISEAVSQVLSTRYDVKCLSGASLVQQAGTEGEVPFGNLHGVLFLAGLDDDESVATEWSSGAPTLPSCKLLLDVVRLLARDNSRLPLGLIVLTSGACAVRTQANDLAPFQSPLLGLGKTLAIEHPELNYRAVDLDPADKTSSVNQFARMLGKHALETEQAIRGDAIFVPRLTPATPATAPDLSVVSTYRLSSTNRGQLANLAYTQAQLPALNANEVLIRVRSSGLNFRDVLNALGNYAGGEVPFGSECSGTVAAVGSEVSGVSVGDAVLAIAEHAFADRVIAKRELVARKPESLSFDAAACFPIAFLTAQYCIDRFARLKAGDTILVHAGAGGVGMACIQLAKRVGARVYATAGSAQKRLLLERMGVRATFSSREADFVDDLMRETDGQGVDVVINSLTGDFIPASLDALSANGRFVEIGRAEIWSDEQVAARRSDVEYTAVDLSADMLAPGEDMNRTLSELMSALENNEIEALPVRAFSRDETVTAFRFMAQAQHIGKVAISAPADVAEIIKADASYLITGAYGSLGRISASCLVEQGARSLVLVGRREADADARLEFDRLRSDGILIEEQVFDIADSAAIAGVFESCRAVGRPIAGILHCAGTLSDAPLLQQSWPEFEKVFAAKVRATWHLHQETLSNPVDFFVSYSSIASILGSAGQANHCAANTFMDVLAVGRRLRGLPATSINWGVWSEIGAAVERNVAAAADARGLAPITNRDGIAHLLQVMSSARGQTMVQAVDWSRFMDGRPSSQGANNFFANLIDTRAVPAAAAATVQSRREELENLPDETRKDQVRNLVRDELATVLGLEKGSCPADDLPLKDAGLDSLLAVELRNALGRAIEERLPATLMFDYPTIQAVTNFIHSELFPDHGAAMTPDSDTDDSDLDDLFGAIEGMSDTEAAAAFKEKVEEHDHRE